MVNCCFLNDKALLRFHPDSIQKHLTAPAIYLTQLMLSGEKGTEIKQDFAFRALNGKKLQVQSNQSMIRLQFAALNYLNPQETTYAYRLKGFDDAFIDLGKQREITFVDLPPKVYELEITAKNNEGLETNQPIALKIEVIPPFLSHQPRLYLIYTFDFWFII